MNGRIMLAGPGVVNIAHTSRLMLVTGQLNHKKIIGSFSDVGTIDFRFGFIELKNYKDYVRSLDERYVLAHTSHLILLELRSEMI